MKISYRHNAMQIHSIDAFLNIRGGYHHNQRDVYFIRGLGEPADIGEQLLALDRRMDRAFGNGQQFYLRVTQLPRLESAEAVKTYSESCDAWEESGRLELECCRNNPLLAEVLADASKEAVGRYRETKAGCTRSMEKNFTVKLWFWLESLFGGILPLWKEQTCIKVLADNVVNVQEYLFYYMLTLIGCDVFLIESRKDLQADGRLMELSAKLRLGEYGTAEIPPYVKTVEEVPVPAKEPVKLTIPEHPGRRTPSREPAAENPEKSFEELALLASSVVMISVHDDKGEPVATGSGIMIGKDGYLLTNYHVIRGGCFYSVRIEDDGEIYRTDEVIKYNPVQDLAVLRIDRVLAPIPIYGGSQKLARGQKVVAIGSPLGLFNSVSDGIISGFRKIDDVDMIQFTAPTSHGSSGGAVLNMQGEVIGISTAGIDNAQNINLAVGYESIRMFARGFF